MLKMNDWRSPLVLAIALLSPAANAWDHYIGDSNGLSFYVSYPHAIDHKGERGTHFIVITRMNAVLPRPDDAVVTPEFANVGAEESQYNQVLWRLFTRCDRPPALEVLERSLLNGDLEKVASYPDSVGEMLPVDPAQSVGRLAYEKACEWQQKIDEREKAAAQEEDEEDPWE